MNKLAGWGRISSTGFHEEKLPSRNLPEMGAYPAFAERALPSSPLKRNFPGEMCNKHD